MEIIGKVQSETNQPLLFRTSDKVVFHSTCSSGSLWLRTSHYYRGLEDIIRNDKNEGCNVTQHEFPLHIKLESGSEIFSVGSTHGAEVAPNYIMSLHGVGIKERARVDFGGFTLGVKSILRLTAEIVYQASKQLEVCGYTAGPVKYQRTAYCLSNAEIRVLSTDILRKDPVEPFIFQDEWRVVIFVKNYLNNDPNEPLKLNVTPSHFYEYIVGNEA